MFSPELGRSLGNRLQNTAKVQTRNPVSSRKMTHNLARVSQVQVSMQVTVRCLSVLLKGAIVMSLGMTIHQFSQKKSQFMPFVLV